jgi:hypothetical protein
MKYFNFFGNIKHNVNIDELFNTDGSLTNSAYEEIEKNIWHYKSTSYATLMYIASDLVENVRSIIRDNRIR